jgi:hypothetical protein
MMFVLFAKGNHSNLMIGAYICFSEISKDKQTVRFFYRKPKLGLQTRVGEFSTQMSKGICQIPTESSSPDDKFGFGQFDDKQRTINISTLKEIKS